MTIIELGEVSSGSTAPEPPAPPLASGHLRRYAVAAVAVLCLLVVAGAQRPESRSLPVLWSTAGQETENFLLTRDTLYVFGPPTRAYDAATGRLRWTRPATDRNTWVYAETNGVVLVPGETRQHTGIAPDGTPYQEEYVADTVALDAATGAQLWRQPGEMSWTAPDTALLTRWDFRDRGLLSARVVRLTDGRPLWTWTPRDPVLNWTPAGRPGQPPSLVTATPDGRIEVRRFADGTVSARGRVPWVANRESDGAFTDLTTQHDTIFVARSTAGRVTVDAYALDTLRHLWTTTSAMYTGIIGCGHVMCLGGEPRGLVGRDPRTGRVRWRMEGWDSAHAMPDGRLLLMASDTGRSGLADGTTGRLLADLGTRPALFDAERGTVVTLTPTREPVGGTAVHEVGAGGVRTLRGLLAGNTTGCQVGGRRLACVSGGALTVRAVG
jgi:hypothetical protein